MSEELKPCPFCGNSDVYVDKGVLGNDELGNYFVCCEFCHTTGPAGKTEDDAVASWNRRA